MTVAPRTLGMAVVATMLALGSALPAQAGQNPYEGVLESATCSPSVTFTAISMGWDLDYLYDSDFGGLGPCVVPDLSELLGTWTLVSQQIQFGANTLIGNAAGKTLTILPAAVFELDPMVRGVMAQEEWQTEKFCIEGAAAAPTCGMALPGLLAGFGVASCQTTAVFTGAVRSDVYVQSSGPPSQPVGPFTLVANYAVEAERVGGEILDRSGTRLRLRIVNRGGGTTWAILDTRANGAYELEIIDEAGLDLSLEFDSAAMFDALTRVGTVAIYGILFDVNLADLRPGSGEMIDTVAEVLKANPDLRIEIQGHTDSTGAAERNRQLSLERAQSVAAALALYGVEPNRLVPRGLGPDQPVADNADEQGRQQNRRVELVRIP